MKPLAFSIRWTGRVAVFMLVVGGLFACASATPARPLVTDPGESLKKAIALLEDKEFEEARQLLNEIRSVDTTRTYASLAQLKIAESYAMEDDDELAVAEYRKFLEWYPDSQYAPYAQYQIATIYFGQIKAPDRGAGAAKLALNEYLLLKERYPRNPYRENVEANIRKSRNTIAEYEFLVGKFYFKKESYRAALGRFLGITSTYPDFIALDAVYYHIALSYARQGDGDNARKYADLLGDSFPHSRYGRKLSKEMSDE